MLSLDAHACVGVGYTDDIVLLASSSPHCNRTMDRTDADDATRRAVLRAASELLVSEGVAGLTNRRIADLAGCSTMAIYSRFGSKGGILDALYREGVETLSTAQSAIAVDPRGIDEVLNLCLAYREIALEYTGHFQILFGHIPDWQPSDELRADLFELFIRLRAACERAVSGGGAPGPAEELCVALMAHCHGHVSLDLAGYRQGLCDVQRSYVDGIRRCLGQSTSED